MDEMGLVLVRQLKFRDCRASFFTETCLCPNTTGYIFALNGQTDFSLTECRILVERGYCIFNQIMLNIKNTVIGPHFRKPVELSPERCENFLNYFKVRIGFK